MSETLEQTAPNDLDPNAGATQTQEQSAEQTNQQTEGDQQEREVPPQKKYRSWEEARLERFTRQKHALSQQLSERDQRLAALERELAQYRQPAEPKEQAPRTEQEIRADVERQQAATRDTDDFNRRCNDIAAKGTEAFGQEQFGSAIQNWNKAGLDLEDAGHRSLLNDISTLPDAAALYYHIGTDPDLAAHLLDLPNKQAYAELREIARERPWTQTTQGQQPVAPPPAPPQVSNAPRPAARGPGPVRQSSRSIYEAQSMEDFIAMRNKKR